MPGKQIGGMQEVLLQLKWKSMSGFERAVKRVEKLDGKVLHAYPPSVMVVSVPANNVEKLTGSGGILSATTELVGENKVSTVERQVGFALQTWNNHFDVSRRLRMMAAPELGVKWDDTSRKVPDPPRGVDAGAFYNLVQARNLGCVDTILALNRSVNNTSIVFCMEWRGKRLLFPGDAEISSCKQMEKVGVLREVDFLKISHHGSSNGTPHDKLLKKILPEGGIGFRQAALSSYREPYESVPDPGTLTLIQQRSRLVDSRIDEHWLYQDIFIEP